MLCAAHWPATLGVVVAARLSLVDLGRHQPSRHRTPAAGRSATRRARNYAARELIHGRWIATAVQEHGTQSTYTNHGCRCPPCRRAGSAGARPRPPAVPPDGAC